jgi:hypothetical protein
VRPALVGCARRDDPSLGLARQLRHVFEISVVVQDGKTSRFRNGSNEHIDKREHSVLVSARYWARGTLRVSAPRGANDVEIEPVGFAQQRDEFESAFGIDDLKQRLVDRVAQGRGSEDLSGLIGDISIDFN